MASITTVSEKAQGKKLDLEKKHSRVGWMFLAPATLLICWMNFYPMIRALILSFQSGATTMTWTGLTNYTRIFSDRIFMQSIRNTFFYLVLQVPIMLFLALILASMLNSPTLRFKGFFRTAIFLPCATSLVSYSIIFRSLFATEGLVNSVLVNLGILESNYNFLGNPWSARFIIVIALVWRWTGYNMVFYLSGLQNIEGSIYEAARIDGANYFQQLTKITIPLLKPIILLTTIMSTNGTLQLFDESWNLTSGGPANSTITMSHHIYATSFVYNPNFGYAAAMSYVIFFMVAILALIQMKVGDKR